MHAKELFSQLRSLPVAFYGAVICEPAAMILAIYLAISVIFQTHLICITVCKTSYPTDLIDSDQNLAV